jgi:hypothetical protein
MERVTSQQDQLASTRPARAMPTWMAALRSRPASMWATTVPARSTARSLSSSTAFSMPRTESLYWPIAEFASWVVLSWPPWMAASTESKPAT